MTPGAVYVAKSRVLSRLRDEVQEDDGRRGGMFQVQNARFQVTSQMSEQAGDCRYEFVFGTFHLEL